MEPQVAAKIARERQSVRDDPGSAAAWGSLARTLQAHGLEEEAARSYSRAVELDPADFRWPYLRAAALRDTRPGAALAAADQAARLNPDYAPAHLLAGELLERVGEPREALIRYRRALAAEPRSAPAEFGIGRLLMRDGELNAAGEHLERAAALQPRAGPVRAALARLYARRGETEAARAASDAARVLPAFLRQDDPLLDEVGDEAVSKRGYQERALRAEAAGNPQEAEALYERLLEIRPEEADILYNFGNLYVRGRRFGKAVERFRESLARRPDHVPARVNLGNALLMLGRTDEAETELLRALAGDPTDPDAHRTLGGLSAYRGDNAAAARHYRAVLDISPQEGETHRDLAVVLAAAGEFGAAREHAAAAEKLGAQVPPSLLAQLRAARPR